jgi:hypothetical protein
MSTYREKMNPYREKSNLPLWEYCLEHSEYKPSDMIVLANRMSEDGWELVSVLMTVDNDNNNRLTGIFKRIKL